MLQFLKTHAGAAATMVLLIQSGVYYSASRTEVIPSTPPWSNFATQINDWRATEDFPMDDRTRDQLQPDDYLIRNYVSNHSAVGLFIGYWKTQRRGFAPHSPEACLPGAGWQSVSSEVIRIPFAGGTFPANQYLVSKADTELVVIYWYLQGSRPFTSQLAVQFYTMPELLLHGRTDTGLVRVITSVQKKDLAAAKQTATQFAQEIYPLIIAYIP